MAERSTGHRGPDGAGSDTGFTPGERSDGDSETPGLGVTPSQEEEEEDEGHQVRLQCPQTRWHLGPTLPPRDLPRCPPPVSPRWRVGDACSAVWGGDGLLYPAHLRALDPVSGTCLVEFDGYGNTEERALAQLLPPGAWGDTDAPHGGGPRRRGAPSSQEPPMGVRRRKGEQVPRSPRPPEAMPAPWPPTPLRAMREEEEEEEALTAMLMSWYMSGYHTGFYVGLREGRAEAAEPPPRPHRREKQPMHS